MSTGQQILGKRSRESEAVESAENFKMPYFRPDEVIFDKDTNGVIVGMRPKDPRADEWHMVVKNPYGRSFNGTSYMFQIEPLTQRGKDVVKHLCTEEFFGIATGQMRLRPFYARRRLWSRQQPPACWRHSRWPAY